MLLRGLVALTLMLTALQSTALPLGQHMTTWKAAAALIVVTVLFATAGIRGFLRRAVD